MFLDIREAAKQLPDHVFATDNLRDLYRNNSLRHGKEKARLLCLMQGLHSRELQSFMNGCTWPVELIANTVLPVGEYWMITPGNSVPRPLAENDLQDVIQAAGIGSPPRGNIRCTWSLRKYSERESQKGGLEWISSLYEANHDAAGPIKPLLKALINLLHEARCHGAALFVEQFTAVIAKDATAPNPCLTPRLHADEYYGLRETAIASLLERGWSKKGGTWFLPTNVIADYPEGDQITPVDIERKFPGVPVVCTGSGDVCFYDGMRNPDNVADPMLGVPHISADLPGESSRLVILMHHKPSK